LLLSSSVKSSPALDAPAVSWRRLVVWLLPGFLLALYYEVAAWHTAGTLGFPLDDAWIHAQFARNLATGHGFSYTGGRWVAASTSPAWTILLALGYLVARSVLVAAKVLGVALQFTCGILAARLVLALSKVHALAIAAGLLVAAAPAMVWGAVSGMEVGLASALVLGGFLLYLTSDQPRRQVAAVFLLSLACLARPETLVPLGIVALHFAARARTPRVLVRSALAIAFVVLVVLGPFVLFDYVTTGRALPTTFYAKSGPGLARAIADGNRDQIARLFLTHGPTAVRQFGATLVDQFGIAAIVIALGFGAAFLRPLRRRGAWLIAVCVLAGSFAMGLVAPQRLKPENFRYTAQLISLAAVLGVAGLSVIWSRIRQHAVRIGVLVFLVGIACYRSAHSAEIYAFSVKNIQELHITLAEWMRIHLPPGATIAVNDVGALAYFGGHDVIDLEGLVSPEALAYPRAQRGLGFSQATKPDYVAIFPGWYPDISGRPDLFHEIHRVEISDNRVSAGSVLILYSTPWTRFPPVPHPPTGAKRRRWPA
jgi:hypothetical protein